MPPAALKEKKDRLRAILSRLDNIGIAFSGGVDSTFLLAMAHDVLGKKAVALTAVSSIHPEIETAAAVTFARSRDIEQVIVPSSEMDSPEFTANGKDRCYICKKSLFQMIVAICARKDIQHIAHGANMDDLTDYRPGYKATVELGILAPLIDAGLTKNDIRLLSKEMGLSTWDKASLACLASRIPYYTRIEKDALKKIEAAERFLLDRGFKVFRVRHHHETARIEMAPSEFERICDPTERASINRALQRIGYHYVSVDLGGYVSGNMNKGIMNDSNGK